MVGEGDNELPLLVAALRTGFAHIVTSPTFFYAPLDRAPLTEDYPLEEINDYLRLYPERRETIARTLAYFDPLFFASSVRIPTLLWGDPETAAPLAKVLSGSVELRETERSEYKDGLYQERWISHQLGFPDVIIPAVWQEVAERGC